MHRIVISGRITRIAASLAAATSLSACISLDDVVGNDFDLCRGVGPVATVRADPTRLSVRAGDSLAVNVAQRDAKGNNAELCTAQSVTWSSDQANVAAVQGLVFGQAMVRGVSPGATVLRATTSSFAVAVPVTVVAR